MPRTILVVDDSEINRRILSRILASDYAVIEAEDGLAASRSLSDKHQQISAVLLDLMMPVMDGYEVLERMRANPALAQIPVIVMTGDTLAEAERRALALGANDFVTKPFDADILLRRLSNLIRLRETSAIVNTYQKDKLTGLWNRETFFEKAAWAIKRGSEGSYVLGCLDIDNFKLINDSFGMEKGDEVLKCLARLLKDESDRVGGIVGRITADNFVSLYPRTLVENGRLGPKQLEARLAQEVCIPVTLSVGRYLVTDKSLTISAMYDRASLAQQTVKGRYDVHAAFFDESMRLKLLREQEIVNNMNRALDEGHFEAWYQPQYNHATGALVGAEALARWRHPDKGLISPGEFIPVFERNGFIYELDKYIWEQVCRDLRRWTDAGRAPLPVSVNISRSDLLREGLSGSIAELTDKYALPRALLRLEVTESAFAGSGERVVSVVKELIALGFTVEIDDFGSGYSSLNTLKDVPAQILKLDMKFFDSSICSLDGSCYESSTRGGNILQSVVRMAKWLGMSVIAEGVEDISKADFLRSIGCNYIQGYLYARPMPCAEYEALAGSAVKEERLIKLETVRHLDNNSFWDPDSIDTLIFNSYVGAASIMEYHAGKIELLRATDKCAAVFSGGDGLSVEELLKLDLNEHMDEVGRHAVGEAVKLSVETRSEITGEYVFFGLPGCAERTYLRTTLRVIASAGDRYLAYCTNENITEQRKTDFELGVLLSSIPSGVMKYSADEKGEFAYINRNLAEGLGYTEKSFREKFHNSFHEMVYIADRERVEMEIIRQEGDGGIGKFDYRIEAADGSLRWFHDEGAKICDRNGREWYYVCLVDVTAQYEAQLRNTGGITLESMPSCAAKWMFSNGGVLLLDANSKYLDFVGVAAGEALGRSILFWLPEEERGRIMKELYPLGLARDPIDVTLRVPMPDGRDCWFSVRASFMEQRDGCPVYCGTLTEVTELISAREQLRISQEEYRLAAALSNRTMLRCDVRTRMFTVLSTGAERRFSVFEGKSTEAVGELFRLTSASLPVFNELVHSIEQGKKSTKTRLASVDDDGRMHWAELEYSLIFDMDGEPVTAIISVENVTEMVEKEAVYMRWQQSITQRSAQDYTLFRWNLSNDRAVGHYDGSLLDMSFDPMLSKAFNDNTAAYAKAAVHPDERAEYTEFLDSGNLLAAYHHGARSRSFEYRELTQGGERWLRVTVELVEYPNLHEIEAYVLYENIDERKRGELMIQKQATLDPLTGVLNRATFAMRVGELSRRLAPGTQLALIMMDVDGFKQLNDTLGHAAGDQALIDMSNALRAELRSCDLLGRLGGDEFLIALADIRSRRDVERKAERICSLLHKMSDGPVETSVSMGIALYPTDGNCFDAVYRRADAALYAVKSGGKNGFRFYDASTDSPASDSRSLPRR